MPNILIVYVARFEHLLLSCFDKEKPKITV